MVPHILFGASPGVTGNEDDVAGNLQRVMLSVQEIPYGTMPNLGIYHEQLLFILSSRFLGNEEKTGQFVQDMLARKHLAIVFKEGTTINADRFKGAEMIYTMQSGLTAELIATINMMTKRVA